MGFDKTLVHGVVQPLSPWGLAPLLGGAFGAPRTLPLSHQLPARVSQLCVSGALGSCSETSGCCSLCWEVWGSPCPSRAVREARQGGQRRSCPLFAASCVFSQLCCLSWIFQPPDKKGDRHKARLGWEGQMQKSCNCSISLPPCLRMPLSQGISFLLSSSVINRDTGGLARGDCLAFNHRGRMVRVAGARIQTQWK